MFEEDGKRQAVQGIRDCWKEDMRVSHAKAFVFEEPKQVATRWWPTLSEVKNVSWPDGLPR